MSRAKKEKEVFGEAKLSLTPDEKRFATHAAVAVFRAERLRCNKIVDLCSGAGFQSFAFVQTCTHVLAIEKDPLLFAKAQEHAKTLGITNITFLCGDVLAAEIVSHVKTFAPDIVFCDPERFASEEARSLSTIQPNIPKLLSVYGQITDKIAVEFPPYIQTLEFPAGFSAEAEYLSLDGALNRLTLYFGSLRTCVKRVVLLPEKEVLCSTATELSSITTSSSSVVSSSSASFSYLLEPNPALAVSGLVPAAFASALSSDIFEFLVAAKEIVAISQGKKTFYLSTKILNSPFFTVYAIHAHVPYSFDMLGKKALLKELQHLGVARVVLRYTLDPAKYWDERTFFEKRLQGGTKHMHLFVFDEALICEKM